MTARRKATAAMVFLALLAAAASAAPSIQNTVTCSGHLYSLDGLSGVIVTEQNEDFAAAAVNWNASPLIDQLVPCVVVFCQQTSDAAAALAWAQKYNVSLAVRSGRHSYEGFSLSSGLIIDVSALNATSLLSVNSSSGMAQFSIGAGARLADVYIAVAEEGYVFPGGSCPNVGIGGFVLGGGFGFAARMMGLAIDSLVSIEVVTADGVVRTVSETVTHDLFWALRGGGNGNYGVVTAFTFSLPPIPTANGNITLVELNWASFDPTVKTAVMAAWAKWLTTAPDEVTSELTVYHHSIAALGVLFGSVADAQTLFAGLATAGGGATTVTYTSVGYLEGMLSLAGCANVSQCQALAAQGPADTSPEYWKAKSFYTESSSLSAETLSTIVSYLTPPPANATCCTGFSGLLIDSYGGAIARVENTATAFPHRQATMHMQLMVYFNGTAQAEGAESWASQFGDALASSIGKRRSYRNYPDLDLGTEYADAYYGGNLVRLASLKAYWDPTHVFSYAQAIP